MGHEIKLRTLSDRVERSFRHCSALFSLPFCFWSEPFWQNSIKSFKVLKKQFRRFERSKRRIWVNSGEFQEIRNYPCESMMFETWLKPNRLITGNCLLPALEGNFRFRTCSAVHGGVSVKSIRSLNLIPMTILKASIESQWSPKLRFENLSRSDPAKSRSLGAIILNDVLYALNPFVQKVQLNYLAAFCGMDSNRWRRKELQIPWFQ